MAIFKEGSKKRLQNEQLKRHTEDAENQNVVIDLTNDSDKKESSSSSKWAKSGQSSSSKRISLPYISSQPLSITNLEPRLSTASENLSVKKPRGSPFRSSPWQSKKIFPRDLLKTSPSPTPAPKAQSRGQGQHGTSGTVIDPSSEQRATSSRRSTRSESSQSENLKKDRPSKRGRGSKNNASVPAEERVNAHCQSLSQEFKTPVESSEGEDDSVFEKFGISRGTPKTGVSFRTSLESRSGLLEAPNVLEESKVNENSPKLDGAIGDGRKLESSIHTRPTKSANASDRKLRASRAIWSSWNTPKGTPSTSRVVVQIDKPGYESSEASSSSSSTLLNKFRKPLPLVELDRSEHVVPSEGSKRRDASLLAELKKDTSIARTRASTVEEIFGSHGLSKYYDDTATSDTERRSLAQPKAKKVKRSKIKLDWGRPPAASVFNREDIVSPLEQARQLLDAKFEDVSVGAPLTFLNERNDRRIDGKFQFVSSYVRREGVREQSAPADFGCTCIQQCDPANTACPCFRTLEGDRLIPYTRCWDGLVILNPSFIHSVNGTPQEIFECSDACNCSQSCFNRVVQKGRTIPLEIFMTRRCGFGIRSPEPIRKGQFIDVYLGELLTTKAVEDYENASTEESSSYIFSLDFFGPASYHIQGLHFGSPTRFINHSCNPNARIFTVMMNHADQKIYKLAYFAIRDIPAKKEITFDYCPETADEEPWIPSRGEEDEGVVRCLCGERNCRGRVWPKRQMAMRRGRGWART